jgi:PAS domain S-box-containing protein
MKITKILIIDDSPQEAGLIENELYKEGLKFSFKLVKTRKDFIQELRVFKPDLILSDYNLEDFSGLSALEIRNNNSPETPFIMLSNTYNDDLAIKSLTHGATDCVPKDVFGKLSHIVRRAVDEIEDRLEHEKVEKALIKNEEKLRKILDSSPEAIIVTNLNDDIYEFNQAALELYGTNSRDEIMGKNFRDLIVTQDRGRALKDIKKTLITGSSKFKEYNFLRKNATEIPVEISTSVLVDLAGKPNSFVSIVHDITEHKIAEEKIRKSLQEKEHLLREIHHRVKNNMQIISSLISLQSRMVYDKRDIRLFSETKDRVRTMGIIHELLYESVDISSVNFTEYVETLILEIRTSHKTPLNVKMDTKLDHVQLNIETALTCGLIINEIVTNALKHAFPDNRAGKITVILEKNKNELTLIISDNGIGMLEAALKNAKTFGLNLVDMLLKQLKAGLEFTGNNGTEFKIKFRELNYN